MIGKVQLLCIFILALSLRFATLVTSVTVANGADGRNLPEGEFPPGKVSQINAENINAFMSKTPLVLEFKAEFCHACQNFGSQYLKVASLMPDHRFGQVDVSENPALLARFDVTHIPAIFLYKDGKMYKYNGALLVDHLVSWVTSGYKKDEAISLLSSPIGPLGVTKGILISIGVSLIKASPFLTTTLGLPEWMGFLLITLGIALVIIFVTFIGVYFSVYHAKQD